MATLTEKDRAQRQRKAASALSNLLARRIPYVGGWDISYDGDGISGCIPSGGLDELRATLHQWAALLDDPEWRMTPNGNRRKLAVVGTWKGVKVQVWDLVEAGHDLAELSASPAVDAPAERAEVSA